MKNKQFIRDKFRTAVFERDKYTCVTCGLKAKKTNVQNVLDAHHITDRNEIENGGYIKENGISLCKIGENCHMKAEHYHSTGTAILGFSIKELYEKIGSSEEKAREAAAKL